MELFRKEYLNEEGIPEFWITIRKAEPYTAVFCSEEINLVLVLCGRVRIYSEGKFNDFSAGDIYSINPKQFYSQQLLQENTHLMILSMDAAVRARGQIDYWFGNRFVCCSNENTRSAPEYRFIRYYLAGMFHAMSQEDGVYQFELNGQMIVLHAHLIRHFTAIENLPIFTPPKVDAAAQAAAEYTKNHFLRPLTLEDVSRVAGKNRTYFSSYFKKQMGYSWYQFLTWQRLGKAAELLNETEDKLVDIAFASGFYDSKSFFTAFKRFFGLSPKEYRRVNLLRRQCLPTIFNENEFHALMKQYRTDGP